MVDLARYTVSPTDSIRRAMEKIDNNKHRAVVVVDEGSRVLGTVSDGDIRRAFLRETLPMAPVESIMNLNCRTTRERDPERQARLIREAKVTVLPVVDAQNRLVDVVVATEPFDSGGRTA